MSTNRHISDTQEWCLLVCVTGTLLAASVAALVLTGDRAFLIAIVLTGTSIGKLIAWKGDLVNCPGPLNSQDYDIVRWAADSGGITGIEIVRGRADLQERINSLKNRGLLEREPGRDVYHATTQGIRALQAR